MRKRSQEMENLYHILNKNTKYSQDLCAGPEFGSAGNQMIDT
jgi:hypothetical protein